MQNEIIDFKWQLSNDNFRIKKQRKQKEVYKKKVIEIENKFNEAASAHEEEREQKEISWAI